eukprot:1159437-Pelagomonas_calceolata.AAC.9
MCTSELHYDVSSQHLAVFTIKQHSPGHSFTVYEKKPLVIHSLLIASCSFHALISMIAACRDWSSMAVPHSRA